MGAVYFVKKANNLSKSTSYSSLRAPTRNPFNIGEVLRIPGQARDDGRWTKLFSLIEFNSIAAVLLRAKSTLSLLLSGKEV